MAVTDGLEPDVLVLDIRDRDVGDEGWSALGRVADRGRVLVVDRVESLAARQIFYEDILGTRAVQAVLCIAVGSPRRGSDALLTISPAMATSEVTATLWVGDGTSVEWDMDRGRAFPPAEDPDRTLASLTDVLSLPEVFDAVVARMRDIPYRLASAGITMTSGSFGDELLADALAGGLDRLTGGAEVSRMTQSGAADLAAADRSPTRILRLLLNDNPVDVADPLVPRERMSSLRDQAKHRAEEVSQLVAELETVGALTGNPRPGATAVSRVRASGSALRALRQTADTLFEEADGFDGTDHSIKDRLAREGVRTDLAIGPGSPSDALRVTIKAEFTRRVSLQTLAVRLRAYAAQVAPGGSGAFRDHLHRACPDALLNDLDSPRPFPLDAMRSALLVGALAFGAVLGIAVGPLAGTPLASGVRLAGVGLIAAMVWVLGVTLLMARVPEPEGEHGWRDLPAAQLFLHGALMLAGVAAGHFIWWLPFADGQLGPPIEITLVVVLAVLVAMGFVLYASWRKMVDQWCRSLPGPAAEDAATRLAEVVRRVAVREWALAERRRDAADAAKTYASVLQDLTLALHRGVAEHRTKLLDRSGPLGPVRKGFVGSPEYGAEFAQLVADDLVDLAAHILDPLWNHLYGTALREVTWRIEDSAQRGLTEYWDHLRRRGVHERPSFGTDNVRRTELAETVWRRSSGVAELVRMPVGGRMIQLCDQDDLHLLQSTSGGQAVRFVPRVAQPPVGGRDGYGDGGAHFPSDVVWTAASQFAGVVRLVPLRTGIVSAHWTMGAQTGPGGGSG
ncbi:hypothetical protein GCM10009555_087990 [Acrocarpospora macrocephala]|uniref:Uncharacterized protein n=1 Tax=Acrocarpospora macrocephala TaxID=150177 RepID=A0A5M3WRG2_9ACTN|nr:hypothetical protein [Acrocarpospora macrocephala]GES08768.1 hypothetical protein Amac_023640 [Acrocarpospora macrocephala]